MGERMEERRKVLGLDQGEVVARVMTMRGRSKHRPSFWNEWGKKDAANMHALTLLYLARVLETSAEWLMLGEAPISAAPRETTDLVRQLKKQLPQQMEACDAQTLSSVVFHGREPTIKLLHVWYQTLTALAEPRK